VPLKTIAPGLGLGILALVLMGLVFFVTSSGRPEAGPSLAEAGGNQPEDCGNPQDACENPQTACGSLPEADRRLPEAGGDLSGASSRWSMGVPAIDAQAPARVETATFALG
jgi:hypothetical protein